MKIFEFRLNFHWSLFSINNIPALVQIMAWRRPGDKPLFEPMMVNLRTHICVTRPQWVNSLNFTGTCIGFQYGVLSSGHVVLDTFTTIFIIKMVRKFVLPLFGRLLGLSHCVFLSEYTIITLSYDHDAHLFIMVWVNGPRAITFNSLNCTVNYPYRRCVVEWRLFWVHDKEVTVILFRNIDRAFILSDL